MRYIISMNSKEKGAETMTIINQKMELILTIKDMKTSWYRLYTDDFNYEKISWKRAVEVAKESGDKMTADFDGRYVYLFIGA